MSVVQSMATEGARPIHVSVLRVDGTYIEAQELTRAEVEGADLIDTPSGRQRAVWRGGYVHEVTPEIAGELLEAGYQIDGSPE